MKILAVTNQKEEKAFIRIPHLIYKNDKNYIYPLEKDIREVFSRDDNPYFKSGDAIRWILFDHKNNPIGRIAAFHHQKLKNQNGEYTGGIGFFECIENKSAAFLLFDTCKSWLQEKGLKSMDGPINFGEKDRFWGLMVSGFKNPSYLENYNPPYYQAFFEEYGFKKIIEQSTSEITLGDFNYERFNRIASRVLNNTSYRFEHYRDNDIDKFASDFVTIYNQAWANRPDFTPMTMERVMTTLKALRPILMEDIIWFAYANNEPAGFYINTIDVNLIFKHLKGKFNLISKLKFLWFKKFGNIDRVRGIVFGIVPKYQNLGLETGMIMKLYESVKHHHKLASSELAWIGDFNPKMHSLFEALGAKTTKIHYTYNCKF